MTGCDDPRVRFKPQINLQPTARDAGSPTGLDVHLEVPQRNQTVDFAKELYSSNGPIHGVDTPPMKKVVVTFPPDMTISTSAAQGLGVCSSAQLALGTNKPVTCPDNSQYGQLTLHTPILPPDQPMRGYIYIAKKGDNPYNNFLSMYFVIQEPQRDLLIKIPGKIDLDPVTGQIKVTFDDLPQFPMSDMQLTFKGGVRSALVNPRTCGSKKITATSTRGPTEHAEHRVELLRHHPQSRRHALRRRQPLRTARSTCRCRPARSTRTPAATRPFLFRMTRTDDDQEISQIGTEHAAGADRQDRRDDALLRRGDRSGGEPAADGPMRAREPSCPASSLIGSTDVGSGVGVPLSFFPRAPLPRRALQGGAALVRRRSRPAMPGPL